MKVWWKRWTACWADPKYRYALPLSAALFAGALWVNTLAIQFATEHAGNPVSDIILSNTAPVEVDGLFVYGTMLMIAFSVLIVFIHPKRIPFAFHTLTLFILIRAVFTSLTHTGPFEETYISDFGHTINRAFFGADHFFSGHTGMPFLGALGFWHIPWIRNVFLAATGYFAVIVLIGHLHYTIDVAAAFFITYSIYDIAVWLFPEEHKLFQADAKKEL